jgi:hypothetical protein
VQLQICNGIGVGFYVFKLGSLDVTLVPEKSLDFDLRAVVVEQYHMRTGDTPGPSSGFSIPAAMKFL